MKLVRTSFLLIALALLLAGCGRDPVSEPAVPDAGLDLASAWVDAEVTAGEIMAVSGWEFDPEVAVPDRVTDIDVKCLGNIIDYSREMLTDDVAHYTFLVQVGPGEFDRIMVHRVVKERNPFRPIRTRHAIFLQHGDAVGFVKFLYGPAAPSAPDDHAAAIYLAQLDVDVWGIDQNWVLVPEETADFGFMQDWGMDNQIENLNTGLAVARYTRLFTGNGFRKMHLLGYSSGGATGYAYINAEATIPYGHRHVKGFVCADMVYKYAPEDEESRQFICSDVEVIREHIEAGNYAEPIPFVMIGELAALDADGDSPIIPGMTNLQVALLFSAGTFQVWPYNPWFHYFGGTFDDETGMPVALSFTSIDGMTDFMRTGIPWEARLFMFEYEQILCDDEDVPWDDNLAAVTMPILYLEPAGGIGQTGRYTLGLFGSSDIQIATASLRPPEQVVEDFGHIDMWTAPEAPDLVWAPLLEWITTHNGRGVDDDDYPLMVGID